MENFSGDDFYSWVVLPIIICVSRIGDVSLGTLRHVFIAKGFKNIAPFFGFFEVLIWILVVKQVMTSADNWACYLGWSLGFACGNYIGLRIEEKLALGMQVIRIISNKDCTELIETLKKENHGVTIVDGNGAYGPVKMIFTIAKRKTIPHIEDLITNHNPGAFYSIEDVKDSSHGVFNRKDKPFFAIKKLFSNN